MPTAIQSVTLNKLIEEFYKLADAHEMLESFYYGNFLEIYQSDASNPIAYKTMLMNVNNASIDPNYVILTVELMVMDKVFKDNDDRQDVESDTLAILGDIFSVVSYSNRWQSFCKIGGASTMRKFVNKGEDQVTGWAMTIQLNVKRKNGLCDLPISDYDYEGTYKPYCAGVRIFRDGLLTEVTPSGGRYDYTTSGSVTLNIDINGTPFLVGVSTDQDINVLSSQLTALGSKVGDNWIVTDAIQTLNGDPITPQIPETTKAIIIQTVDAAPIPVTLITDDALNLVAEVPNAQVNVNNDAFESVAPGGTLNVLILDTQGNFTGVNLGPYVEVQDSDVVLSSQAVPQILQPIRSQQAKTISLIDAIDFDPVQVTVATDTESLAEIVLPNGTVIVKDSAGNILYTKVVKSGGSVNQTVTDVTQTLNGAAITNNKAQTSKAITIRRANNDPVVVTTITDTETVFIGEVPDVVDITKKVYYNRPAIRNLPSYETYDEGWMYTNSYDPPYNITDGVLQEIDYTVNPDYLKYFNAFGHKFRFTGLNGGYYDFNTLSYKDVNGNASTFLAEFVTPVGSSGTDGMIIDHLTGLAYRSIRGGGRTLTASIAIVEPSTLFYYSNWMVPPIMWLLTLSRVDLVNWLIGRAPFQYDQSSTWSCTTTASNTLQAFTALSTGLTTAATKSTNNNSTWCRIHYARNSYVLQP